MKKVLLINTNTERVPYPVPPLGLCLIARSIERFYEVSLFDAGSQELAVLTEMMIRIEPDYIGLSIRNIDNTVMGNPVFYVQAILDTYIPMLKDFPQAITVLGGSGFSMFPRELLQASGLDYGIIGEGESSFPRLLTALDNDQEPADIPGVVYRKDGMLRINPPHFSLAMTKVPVSRMYDLIRWETYRERGSYSLQTKRGCIYSCIYCSYPNLEGRYYRLRDPADIVDELAEVTGRLGDVLVEFVDSTFNSPPGHAEAICEEIIRRKVKIRLRTMGINPGAASPRLFSLMKQAGFRQIDCTPDSASPSMLKTMKKNFSLDQLQHCANLIRLQDMPTMWFFMAGGPGETRETIMETFSFIDAYVSPEDMVFFGEGIRIYPQTELFDIALDQGVISEQESLLDPVYYISPQIKAEELSSLLQREIAKRPNAVHALDHAPKPEMIAEALAIRKAQHLEEPMFRTLLRLRSRYT